MQYHNVILLSICCTLASFYTYHHFALKEESSFYRSQNVYAIFVAGNLAFWYILFSHLFL